MIATKYSLHIHYISHHLIDIPCNLIVHIFNSYLWNYNDCYSLHVLYILYSLYFDYSIHIFNSYFGIIIIAICLTCNELK